MKPPLQPLLRVDTFAVIRQWTRKPQKGVDRI